MRLICLTDWQERFGNESLFSFCFKNTRVNDMDYYLRLGRADELKSLKERFIFRLFEIFPGVLSWGLLILAVLISWRFPVFASIFIICFSIFWLFRTIYFAVHLWSGYKKMKQGENTDWMGKIEKLDWRGIYHLVVIPMYKEPLEIIKGTFDSLIKSDYPKDKMIIVLACEERVKDFVLDIAKTIEQEFSSKFFKLIITYHPKDVMGELGGKGSNETFAAKKAKEFIDSLSIPYEKVIFSSFDADTYIFPKYFSCLTYHYLKSKNPKKTSFQPIPLFINNIWQAPVISRLFSFSSTFWHTMNQERPEKLITFSSHSMSFWALVEVGFKQVNVVSDDSRIFWQCFFSFNGDYEVVPLYYPISMDANVSKSFIKTMVNIYKQQRRWAYGVADIPYFLFGFLKNKKAPLSRKIILSIEVIEGHLSWATASIIIFALGWLPLILGGPEFSQTLLSYNLPKIISKIMTFSMLGLISSAYLSVLLLPPRHPDYGKHKYILFALSWLFFPIMMIFFTSIPALDAQTRLMLGKYMGFWPTEKVRK